MRCLLMQRSLSENVLLPGRKVRRKTCKTAPRCVCPFYLAATSPFHTPAPSRVVPLHPPSPRFSALDPLFPFHLPSLPSRELPGILSLLPPLSQVPMIYEHVLPTEGAGPGRAPPTNCLASDGPCQIPCSVKSCQGGRQPNPPTRTENLDDFSATRKS